ncbi:MAG TPA: 16S rRNA (cytidine(1402)-2'-O)-methyltransferase [Gaiellaceae bacterium]|jgi:16S rRNA (cytidine1402-2'-O)-methyltransferase|nr:16S rRNA (cytidine(1402)-2'-O)-methyltransferase [Gaiellaceae bacterium]
MPLAVCATPIGNLEDVTLRVLRELSEADLVLCEDTRHTRRLLDRHGIEAARLRSYHEHNEAQRTADVLPQLEAGKRVALVSDAGMPAVSDPGGRLVAAALAAEVPVTVLPGPSAVDTALVASGFGTDRFQFLGYLPRGGAERAALWAELARWPHAVVAFESPQRLAGALASLAEAFPERPVAVCRELTKRFEEVARGPAKQLAERFSDGARGEITIVIGPGEEPAEGADKDAAVAAVSELVAAGASRRSATDVVSRLTGVSRNTLYRGSL